MNNSGTEKSPAARVGSNGPAGPLHESPAGPRAAQVLYCPKCITHFKKKFVPSGRCPQCSGALETPAPDPAPSRAPAVPLPQVNDGNAILPAAGFSGNTAALISQAARDEAEKAAAAGGCDISPAIKKIVCADCNLRDRATTLKIHHGKSCAGKKGEYIDAGAFPPCAWAVIPPAIHRVLKISIAALGRCVHNLNIKKYGKETRELALLAKLELENIYEKTGGE